MSLRQLAEMTHPASREMERSVNLRTVLLPACILLAVPTALRAQSTNRYTPTGGAPYAISGTRSDSGTLTCVPDLVGQNGPISIPGGAVSQSPSSPADTITAAGGDPNVVFDVMNDQSLFQGSSSNSQTDIYGDQYVTKISVSGDILTTTQLIIVNRTVPFEGGTDEYNTTDSVVTVYNIVTGEASSTWTYTGTATFNYSQSVQGQTEQCASTDVPDLSAKGSGVWSLDIVPVSMPSLSPAEKSANAAAAHKWDLKADYYQN